MSNLKEKAVHPIATSTPIIDLDMVKTFTAIAESGNMTKAAKMVFRTPAAISMQVKKLEELLKCELLIRKSREVVLTPEGETLLRYGRQLLKLNEELVTQFISPRLGGTVTIGLPEQFSTNELPAILSHFAKSHPSVQVDVVMGTSVDLKAKFDNGKIDLALISLNLDSVADQYHKTIRLERIVWATLENSAVINKTPLPLALAEYGCSWRSLALKALDDAGIEYRIAYSCENCAGQLAAVKADLAIAAVPESLVSPPLVKIDDSNLLPEIGVSQTNLIVDSKASEATLALKEFIEQVLDPRRLKPVN
ncbi:MAG: LysR family transcriptional regulator [Pseudomonadota bacterium]